MQGTLLEFEADTVICREGEPSSDLFFLQSGKLLICTLNGTQVKAISRIGPGEFVGELSFFDGKLRASYVVTLEQCKLIQIPKHEISGHLPDWYNQIGMAITKKIRLLDNIIHTTNLRRSNTEESKPLSQEEQKRLYELLTN